MDYEKLTSDDQYRMLEARLRIYEQKHFDAMLNLEVGEATDEKTRLPELQKRIEDLEACIVHVRERLSKLPRPAEDADRQAARVAELQARRAVRQTG